MADGSTRRVIEVQSDLFQKGGLEKELSKIDLSNDKMSNLNNEKRFLRSQMDGNLSKADYDNYKKQYEDVLDRVKKENEKNLSKLSQYNDPTAHFRMIREEVSKAVEDGKTKLQFPTGETAMKIEGLGQSEHRFYNPRANTGNTRFLPEDKLRYSDIKTGDEVYER